MQANELPFDIIAGPEMIDGLDVLYPAQGVEAEDLWYMLLNKGYRLCATGFTDSSFDLAVTPPRTTTSITYVYLGNNKLNEENIVKAFKKGMTIGSKGGPLVIFRVDGKVSGNVFPADGKIRKVEVEAYFVCNPGSSLNKVEIIRNGKVFKKFNVNQETFKAEFEISEKENAWYLARCLGTNGGRASTSPIYFETKEFSPPGKTPAKVSGKVYAADNLEPLDAVVEIITPKKEVVNTYETSGGSFEVEMPAFMRIRVKAAGYLPLEKSIVLDYPPIYKMIRWCTPEDLQNWRTYEKVGKLLRAVKMDFPLRKK